MVLTCSPNCAAAQSVLTPPFANPPRWRCTIYPYVVMLVCLAVSPQCTRAEEKTDLRARWNEVYLNLAKSLNFAQVKTPDASFKLVERPLLKYANPVRNWQQHGSIYLWSAEGRPAVIGSIWSIEDRRDERYRNIAFEWHSLVDKSLVAKREGGQLWQSEEPGLQWNACPNSDPPAAKRTARLRQMRQIARRIRAVTAQSGESELRLMSQPLYRYPDSVPGVGDGSVFAFVMGTDPELFLLIEARPDGDQQKWYWAFARFTHVALTAKDGERVVFQCKHRRESEGLTKYSVLFRAERRLAELEETP